MSLSFSTIQQILYDWASTHVPLNMPVIWLYPNAPRPTVAYVTLNIISFSQVGWDYMPSPIDNPGNVTMKGDREFILELQAYGGYPIEVLENLRCSLQTETVRSFLRNLGLSFFGQEQINDITDLVDSTFEKRAVVDLYFRIGQSYTDQVGTIGILELSEEFFSAAQILIFDETITIPPS